jgi:hypothetical protein
LDNIQLAFLKFKGNINFYKKRNILAWKFFNSFMKKLLIVALLGISLGGFAQKIKLIEGDLSPLKGQSSVNTEFVYDGMTVGRKNLPEADYLAQKKSDYNAKEPGKGDNWVAKWVEDRKGRFEPQFRELFNKYSEISTTDENAAYTLIFKTTATEPGYNIGISKMPAFINGELWVVDTKDKSKTLAKLTITNVPGSQFGGFDYETGARLQECYAKAGKELGAYIKKQTK